LQCKKNEFLFKAFLLNFKIGSYKGESVHFKYVPTTAGTLAHTWLS